jgi:hypothetical protein
MVPTSVTLHLSHVHLEHLNSLFPASSSATLTPDWELAWMAWADRCFMATACWTFH